MFKLIRKRGNNNPYDLSAFTNVCRACGGLKRPQAYSPLKAGARYCNCNEKSK